MSRIILGLMLSLMSVSAWAHDDHDPGWSWGGDPQKWHSAPGPDIGAGIPMLAVIAGIALVFYAAKHLRRLRK
jgi:hypothetical protein